jgi:hypothetical protein
MYQGPKKTGTQYLRNVASSPLTLTRRGASCAPSRSTTPSGPTSADPTGAPPLHRGSPPEVPPPNDRRERATCRGRPCCDICRRDGGQVRVLFDDPVGMVLVCLEACLG